MARGDSLGEAVRVCRTQAARFLRSQARDEGDARFFRHASDPSSEDRTHLLYGTFSGALASVLLDGDAPLSAEERLRIANALNRFQQPDGTFVMPDVPESARPTHDAEYFAFHCTNYALGALVALGEAPRYPLAFLDAFRSREELDRWMARRNWSRPWMEGNNIVNLASFYGIAAEGGADWARDRLTDLADWHDRHQNAQTGFWHSAGTVTRSVLHDAMAGAAHNLHIYYLLGREVPRAATIIDSCLQLGYMGIRSACRDIDFVDILVNLRRYGHRVHEIDRILLKYLVELLQIQGPDGGFCDNYVTPSELFGCVTRAAESVTWTSWFRLATIGMLDSVFRPSDRDRWVFRQTIGMGYFRPAFAFGASRAETAAGSPEPVNEAWLAAVRRGRFFRQRLTWSVRRRIAS